MVHNLSSSADIKDIWLHFNKERLIRDIILPRKKDKYNYRIGFMVIKGTKDGISLINKFDGTWFKGKKLSLKMAKGSTQPDQRKISNTERKGNYGDDKATQNRAIEIVEQPLYRIAEGFVSKRFKKEMECSFIGVT